MKRAPLVPSGISVVIGIRQRNKILRAGFDRGRFRIRVRIGMMRLDQSDMIEEKLVAPGARRAGRA